MLILILNVLWLFCGGLVAAMGWFIAGLVMIVSIIGIPWARAAFGIGMFTLWPFGRTIVDRAALYGREDVGTGPLGTLGNIVWLLLAGWWLSLGHIVVGIGLCLTIIGIPFGWQHFKLALHTLTPIGKEVVDSAVLDLLPRRRHGG